MGSRGLRGGLIVTVIGFVGCVELMLGRLRPHYLRVGDVSCHCFMLEVVLSLSFFSRGFGLARGVLTLLPQLFRWACWRCHRVERRRSSDIVSDL